MDIRDLIGTLHRLCDYTSDPDRLGNNVTVIIHVLTTLPHRFCTPHALYGLTETL